VYAAKEISNGIGATAAADCIAPKWPVSQLAFPREKSAPATRPLVKILLNTGYTLHL